MTTWPFARALAGHVTYRANFGMKAALTAVSLTSARAGVIVSKAPATTARTVRWNARDRLTSKWPFQPAEDLSRNRVALVIFDVAGVEEVGSGKRQLQVIRNVPGELAPKLGISWNAGCSELADSADVHIEDEPAAQIMLD